MKKHILRFGLISGVIVSAFLIFAFSGISMDMGTGEILGYATMVIAFSSIFFAIRNYRDKYLNGSIDFWNGLKLGLGITAVATVIYVTSWMIISNVMGEDVMAGYFQEAIDNIRASGLSESEIDQKITEMENFREMYKNPIIKIGFTILEIFPVGLIISLISALILKRK